MFYSMEASSPASSLMSSSVDSYAASCTSASEYEVSQPSVPSVASVDGPAASTSAKPASPRKKRNRSRPGTHSRKKEAHHIPRPRNAFILYRCHAVANQLVPSNLESDQGNLSRIISHLWNNLSDSERQVWQEAARREKEEHQRLYPEYKYKPTAKPIKAKGVAPDGSNSKASQYRRDPAQVAEDEEKCEKTADLLLQMFEKSGYLDTEGGVSTSRQSLTSKWKQERKEMSQEKREKRQQQRSMAKSSRQASNGTGVGPVRRRKRRGNASPESESSSASNWTNSPSLPPLDRRGSAAGDLATSVAFALPAARYPLLASTMEYNPTSPHRRSSSVPPLGDTHMGAVPSAGANIMQEPMTDRFEAMHPVEHFSNDWNGLRDQHGAALSMFPSSLDPGNPDVSTGSFTTSSNRKAPPPPIGLGPADSHIARLRAFEASLGAPISPQTTTPFGAAYEFWQSRPKTMASATPRSLVFQITPRALQSDFSGDVSLISPMRSAFGGFRRPSAAWQSWTRSSGFGLQEGDGSQFAMDLTPRAGKTTFSHVMMPDAVVKVEGAPMDDDIFNFVSTPSGQPDGLIARQNSQPMSIPAQPQQDVFAFSPDFLESARSVARSIPGSSPAGSVQSEFDAILAAEISRSTHTSPRMDPQLRSPSQGLGQAMMSSGMAQPLLGPPMPDATGLTDDQSAEMTPQRSSSSAGSAGHPRGLNIHSPTATGLVYSSQPNASPMDINIKGKGKALSPRERGSQKGRVNLGSPTTANSQDKNDDVVLTMVPLTAVRGSNK